MEQIGRFLGEAPKTKTQKLLGHPLTLKAHLHGEHLGLMCHIQRKK